VNVNVEIPFRTYLLNLELEVNFRIPFYQFQIKMPVIPGEIRLFIKIKRRHEKIGARKIQKEVFMEYKQLFSLVAIHNLI